MKNEIWTATSTGTLLTPGRAVTRAPSSPVAVGPLVRLSGRAWAMRLEAMQVLASALRHGVGSVYAEEEGHESESWSDGRTAVIPLYGVITPRPMGLMALLGMGGGLDNFRSQLVGAVQDDSVERIVLDVDSPGGLADQVPETAALIRQARDSKHVVAVANTTAASAAYWLAAQADEVVGTASGEIGSIGVYMLHTDASQALEDQGLNVTLTSAGRYKTEGNQYQPLSPDAREARQHKVDAMYELFVSDVALGRKTTPEAVRQGYGEGRTLLAQDALEAGLIDRVAPLDDVVGVAPVEAADKAEARDRRKRLLELL